MDLDMDLDLNLQDRDSVKGAQEMRVRYPKMHDDSIDDAVSWFPFVLFEGDGDTIQWANVQSVIWQIVGSVALLLLIQRCVRCCDPRIEEDCFNMSMSVCHRCTHRITCGSCAATCAARSVATGSRGNEQVTPSIVASGKSRALVRLALILDP